MGVPVLAGSLSRMERGLTKNQDSDPIDGRRLCGRSTQIVRVLVFLFLTLFKIKRSNDNTDCKRNRNY